METTFDLSSLSDGVSAGDMEQLRGIVGRCLPSSLFKHLLDIEEVSVATTAHIMQEPMRAEGSNCIL